jgi:ABC-type multidrug transport system fused ATPase/permease subunit
MTSNIIKNINDSLAYLPKEDRRKYWRAAQLQCFIALLDLLGIVLLGVVGALTITGIQSQNPTNSVIKILNILSLGQENFQTQIIVLTVIAILVLMAKTFMSIFITRRALRFLTKKSAQLAIQVSEDFFSQEIRNIHTHPVASVQYKLGPGTSSLIVGVLGNALSLLGDIATLFIIAVGILLINPSIAISSIIIFGFFSIGMYKYLQGRSKFLAKNLTDLAIEGNTEVSNYYEAYREIKTLNVQKYFLNRITTNRFKNSEYLAEQVQLPNVSKYLIESLLILGSVSIAAIQFYLNDAAQAVASITIFLASSTRITPSLLRIQQSLVQIDASVVGGAPTGELIQNLRNAPKNREHHHGEKNNLGFVSRIEIKDLDFRYEDEANNVLTSVTLTINPGEFVAFVGPSGAGKSTLFDLILGLNEPTSGSITISNVPPSDAINLWPGEIGYVPQSVRIIDGTVAENVALGALTTAESDAELLRTILDSNLQDYIGGLNLGIHEQISQMGLSLSGGQRQRVGIARALYTNPSIVLLDESTSSLDAQLEADISGTLQSYHGQKTIIMIAHRLSSIVHADQIFYFESGRLRAQGTFSDLRQLVPEFDNQASLLGL